MIQAFGGECSIRDENLFDLSFQSAFQSFDGVDLYPGTIQKLVHLTYSLIKNHPFIDGNKRKAAHVMLILLELNDFNIRYSQDELIKIIMAIASSEASENDLLKWVLNHLIDEA